MSSIKLREYKQAIAALMRETRQALDEADEMLDDHMDSPNIIRDALADVERSLSNVESEVSCMEHSYADLLVFVGRLTAQRDEAIKQRNLIARQLQLEQKKNTDLKHWC